MDVLVTPRASFGIRDSSGVIFCDIRPTGIAPNYRGEEKGIQSVSITSMISTSN